MASIFANEGVMARELSFDSSTYDIAWESIAFTAPKALFIPVHTK
jgi:hypothetical protein